MHSKELNLITQYLVTRGFEATADDEKEIRARMLGHESAGAQSEFDEKAKLFFAHRVDVDDFTTPGGPFTNTLASPALLQGDKYVTGSYAESQAKATLLPYAVFDGNGRLVQLEHTTGVALAIYRSDGEIRNFEAPLAHDMAEDFSLIDAERYSWKEMGQLIPIARVDVDLARRKVKVTPQPVALVVTEQRSGKVLWKQLL